ncbi:MAG: 4-hydroxythreonine-4-phosphate dehydrogenase PdxA [Deltaproteobacteria bacterium]
MLPRIALTLGDVAGIGPEVVARASCDARLPTWCRPIVVGHPEVLRRAVQKWGRGLDVQPVERIDATTPEGNAIPCWNPGSDAAAAVPPGHNDPRAGRAAYECLVAATRAALADRVDAVVTAPLSKAALHLAGLNYPGHTEILAEACGVQDFAMMLYLPGIECAGARHNLGVVHATLHTSIRSVPDLLTQPLILGKIRLINRFLQTVGCPAPRIAVCALNPHAGEEGLFGDEEARIIAPAARAAAAEGVNVTGPLPADTLFKRAVAGEFDGVVAMYHDQGHIALKLVGFDRAVNVTLGLPIVRTSPSHGTAFDIAWQGKARPDGILEAIRVAALLAQVHRASDVGSS